MSITLIPMIFLKDYYLFIISVAVWAIGLGGFWAMQSPVFSNAIDEAIINTGRREEGIYYGIQAFFARLSLVILAICFAIVHTLTGFVEGADTQSDLAVWGIYIHMALLPMIFMFIGSIVLWRFYDLTPEKVKIIKEKLAEIGL